MSKKHLNAVAVTLAFAASLTGCSVNPVTGEKQLSLIPESQELAMGAEQYIPTQQTQGGRFYVDPELTLYVQQVGQKLARVSDRPDLPFEFVVLNSSVPNAWALPGGKIAINRGLLAKLEDEAQLASVLGHEIVHAAARHSVQRMQQAQLISLASPVWALPSPTANGPGCLWAAQPWVHSWPWPSTARVTSWNPITTASST